MPETNALLLTEDGDVIELALGKKDRLPVYRAVIRCERVACRALTTRLDMWFDEDHPYNHTDRVNIPAMLVAARHGYAGDNICGPVVVTGGPDDEGAMMPMTQDALRALLVSLEDIASD
ncbi:DUF3846 domain-containing protein [Embleya sp. NBC_00896]|uniref:DUF3846 domain-containing protein n=1 Tax=Embleya sp. NBC_00896 TaxID=2975961 RepID=UPI002F918651|nr:DUF3846 domain-containing protein [Embleya sp. NBC_00896]